MAELIQSTLQKEATYQAGKAKSPDKYGVRRGTAKLSKSRIKGMTRSQAEDASTGAARKDISRQQDADFRRKHGQLSREERIKVNRETNRPRGVLKKDPQSHYPQG